MPEIKLARESSAKQRASDELSEGALYDVALPPIKDHPVNIPTSSTRQHSWTQNEPSVSAKAQGQMV